METFAATVLALGVVNAILLVVLGLRRWRLAAAAHERERVGERLRPLVLAFVEGEAELPETLSRNEQQVLADVLGSYGRLVRGPAHQRITVYFEERGVVADDLYALAHHRKAWQRATAAFRLGDVGAASAQAGLIAALEEDESRDVRSAALRSLGRLASADAVPSIIAAVAGGRVPVALARWAVLQVGPTALPPLREVLAAESPARRAGAVLMIGLLGDAADAEPVEERLRDGSAEVRAEAARALGRIGGPRSLPKLAAALDDRVPGVRAAAASALGRLGAPDVQRLLELAQEDQFEVARAAAQAAARIDLGAAAAAAGRSPHLREAVELAQLS